MKDLIDKHRKGRLTPDELARLREFFETASYDELSDCFPETADTRSEFGRVDNATLSRMKEHIDAATGVHSPSLRLYRRYRRATIASVIAVPLLAIALMAVIQWNIGRSSNDYYAMSTGAGECSTLSLPDGTSITVNSNSILSARGFSEKSRVVKFDGEAYFDVTRDPEHPFRIETDGMTVEVYGTSFNLLSRGDSNYAQLSLDSGEVSLCIDGRDGAVRINPGQTLLYDRINGDVTISESGTSSSSSWRTGEMFFHQAPPGYVIERIEQTYGISLDTSITNSMDLNFTGMLPSDNLDEALTIIRAVY